MRLGHITIVTAGLGGTKTPGRTLGPTAGDGVLIELVQRRGAA